MTENNAIRVEDQFSDLRICPVLGNLCHKGGTVGVDISEGSITRSSKDQRPINSQSVIEPKDVDIDQDTII